MSPAVINLPILYQEKIKQLEHKLRTKEERIIVLETENAILHLKLAQYWNPTEKFSVVLNKREEDLQKKMNHSLIQLHTTMQTHRKSLQDLRVCATEHLEELKQQIKHYLQFLMNYFQVLQKENQAMHELQDTVSVLREALQDMSERYDSEKQRRKILHNSLIELKGNIRVHCRIRPLLPIDRQADLHDRADGFSEVTFAADDETVLLKCARPGHPVIEKIYNFERVFGPFESQYAVFGDVRPLITSVLDGYNVCIMAYGQTGSGKTYTMMGPHNDDAQNLLKNMDSEAGIIPRAAQELFRIISEKPSGSHNVEISIIEVYNNDIFDLLTQNSNGELGVKRDIITTKEGKIDVPFLTYKFVENTSEVLDLVKQGLQSRVKHPTLIHADSSRSHLVVTLVITTDLASSQETVSLERVQKQMKTKLQLVDLAGSECVGMSGVKGTALREASFINRSLSALSDVLGALSEQRSHIPYRNSKLTHLLQDTIGGDAKLLVMLCISPCQKFTTESQQTLGFGTRARQIIRAPAKKRNQIIFNKSK